MVYCILNSVKLPQADFFVRQLVQILEIGANDMQENVGMEAARKAAEEAARKAAAAAIKNTPEKAEPRPEGFRHGNPPVVHAIGLRTKPQERQHMM